MTMVIFSDLMRAGTGISNMIKSPSPTFGMSKIQTVNPLSHDTSNKMRAGLSGRSIRNTHCNKLPRKLAIRGKVFAYKFNLKSK